MKRVLLAFLTCITISVTCLGQKTLLMLQKKNKNKNVYYKTGDRISFRLESSKRKMTGEILEIRDSVIVFKGIEISIDKISSLYIDEKTKWWLRYKIEQLGLIIGGGYLMLDLINTGQLNNETIKISGTLIGIGLIGKLAIGNRIKIRGRTKLRILKL